MTAYAIILAGLWMIDLSLYPGTPLEIRLFISGFKWFATAPLLIAAGIALVLLVIWLVIKISEAKPTPQIYMPTPTELAEREEIERLRRIAEEDAQKREEEEQIREQERRIAEEASERARFHEMKQTRSANEAAKASLEEF